MPMFSSELLRLMMMIIQNKKSLDRSNANLKAIAKDFYAPLRRHFVRSLRKRSNWNKKMYSAHIMSRYHINQRMIHLFSH